MESAEHSMFILAVTIMLQSSWQHLPMIFLIEISLHRVLLLPIGYCPFWSRNHLTKTLDTLLLHIL